jgi:adenine-specific DNA-methyltransferase
VDCIYIDPPYNTGARDWKYNNDYVVKEDVYRHSKWLSMMKNRLFLAKELLNPKSGVLIVAIDDNELNTTGLLLQELFPTYSQFCITVVHNPNGNQGKNFGIANEFAYFLIPSGDQILSLEDRKADPDIRPLRDVSGNSNMRTDAKNCFYPIFIKDNEIIGFGEVSPDDYHPESANIEMDDGIIAVYPIDASGNERKWVFARQTVETILNELRVEWNKSRKIFDIIRYKTHFTYKSIWNKKEYNANSYGSKLINKILGEKRFDYPKSLYTVAECVRAAVGTNKHAVVLDFFAGSGTTMHAVNLVNAEDSGTRTCIMVTNNEVSDAEAKGMTRNGLKPGDEEWEKFGIARYVTWPRTVCSIEGHDVNGAPLKGDYISTIDEPIHMSDGFKANVKYFKCEWTPRKPEDYLLSNALCLHIREMIELQNAIEIDSVKHVLILNKADFKRIIFDPEIYGQIENIWVNQNIVFNAEELKLLQAKGYKFIPREFFGQELREAAE